MQTFVVTLNAFKQDRPGHMDREGNVIVTDGRSADEVRGMAHRALMRLYPTQDGWKFHVLDVFPLEGCRVDNLDDLRRGKTP